MIFDFSFETLEDGTRKLNIFSDAWKNLFLRDNKIDDLVKQFAQLQDFNSLDDAIKQMDELDNTVIDFVKNEKNADATVDDFRASLNAQTASSKSATIATKALNTALNIGIMLAISVAIKAVTEAWDYFNVTVEETKQKIDEINSSLKTLQTEYDELDARNPETLSKSEQARLNYLDTRIAKEKELLEIQQARLNQELVGGGFTDFFDKDSYTHKMAEEQDNIPTWADFLIPGFKSFTEISERLKGGSSNDIDILESNTSNAISTYKSVAEQIETLKEAQEGLNKSSRQYYELQNQINSLESGQETRSNNMEEQLLTWQDKLFNYEAEIETLEGIINDRHTTSATRDEARKKKAKYEEWLKLAQKYVIELETILTTPVEAVKSIDERLVNVTKEQLQEAFTDEELSILVDQEFNEEATIADLRELLKSLQVEAGKHTVEIEVLTITDTVNNINKKLKPALDSLVDTYTTLFSEEGNYEWQPINVEEFASIGEQLDSLSEEFGINVPTEDYEEFVKILNDSTTTSEQAQQAFDDLASSMINNSNVVQLTDENFNVLRNALENLGVVNATEVLEELKEIKDEVALAGYDLANMTDEEIQKFLEECDATEKTTQYLIAHLIKKNQLNAKPLDTYNDIAALEKECSALKATGDLYEKVAKLKSLYYVAERDRGGSGIYDEIKKAKAEVDALLNSDYQYKFNFDGNEAKNNGSDSSSKSSKDTKETFDWIEKLISRIQRNITNLGKTVSATYRNWSTRNNALAQEMSEINKEINAQMTAYNAYMAKANSISLAESYKSLVRSGAYNISEITDEKLKEQINEYTEWYEKALNCSDAIEDLRANLAELAMTKFNNVSEQYDEQTSLITHHVSMLEGFVSQSEAAGYMASEIYYKAMSEKQQENIAQLQGEYSSLLSTFDEAVKSGSIQKYSSDWYEMLSAINDIELELQDATTQLVEFNQTLQQLSWEVFNRIQDSVSGIVEEANFLIDVLDSKDLHTDKGVITDEGLAVQGLHAVNYNTYMEQALAYADEMAKIEEEIAKDPYDLELVDRRNELLGLQQEAISNAMSEKEAIRDLVSQGYDKMLESLQKVIDKNKEVLNAEKSLFDYERDIESKTSNIANLRKQLQAYSGDNSESAKATIQKLQLSLADAEKDLQQTEYEKYLSDQEQMLDSLMDDTEQWVNERLDNLDGLVIEAVDATNKNAETISNAIHEVSNGYGYKLSDTMETIWDYEENAIDGVCTIVSIYGDILSSSNENIANNITNGTTSVVTAISGLNTSMQTMISELKNIATANANSIAQLQNIIANSQSNSYPTNNSAGYTNTSTNTNTSNSNSSNGGSGKVNGYEAKVNGQLVGRYKTQEAAQVAANNKVNELAEKAAKEAANKDNSPNASAVYNSVKLGVGSQLSRTISITPYAKGTKNAKRGLGIFGEAGQEILIANDGSILLSSGATLYPFQGGEQVIDAKETAETLSNGLTPLSINDFSKVAPNMSGVVRNTNGNVNQDINVSFALPNVTDANSLITELQNNKRFEKVIQGMTADVMVGKNSLSKYKF